MISSTLGKCGNLSKKLAGSQWSLKQSWGINKSLISATTQFLKASADQHARVLDLFELSINLSEEVFVVALIQDSSDRFSKLVSDPGDCFPPDLIRPKICTKCRLNRWSEPMHEAASIESKHSKKKKRKVWKGVGSLVQNLHLVSLNIFRYKDLILVWNTKWARLSPSEGILLFWYSAIDWENIAQFSASACCSEDLIPPRHWSGDVSRTQPVDHFHPHQHVPQTTTTSNQHRPAWTTFQELRGGSQGTTRSTPTPLFR